MSTTLVPPSYYIVERRGQPARTCNTLAEAARAICVLAPRPATVSVLTGRRRRRLTDAELHDVVQVVRSLRLHTSNKRSAIAVAGVHKPPVPRR